MATPGSRAGGQPPDDNSVKPDLLDFLFTLALTIGLAPEILMRNGLAGEDFEVAWPSWAFAFDILTFLLGISILLFSWYGFNASINNKPVLYGSVAGLLRFALDAFLVVLYGFLLIQYRDFEVVVLTITLIFVLYAIWDTLKLVEYHGDPWADRYHWHTDARAGKRTRRFCERIDRRTEMRGLLLLAELTEALSIVYAAMYVLLSIVYFVFCSGFTESMWDWVVLLFLCGTTLLYRVQKSGYKLRPTKDNIREPL